MRQAASEGFVRASKLVRTPDMGRCVLTVLLRLAHDDEHEMHRMSAVWLLNELTPCLGIDITLQYLVPEVLSMAEDPEVRVRRQVAWNLKKMFKLLEANERLVNCFIALTKVATHSSSYFTLSYSTLYSFLRSLLMLSLLSSFSHILLSSIFLLFSYSLILSHTLTHILNLFFY